MELQTHTIAPSETSFALHLVWVSVRTLSEKIGFNCVLYREASVQLSFFNINGLFTITSVLWSYVVCTGCTILVFVAVFCE